jgi:hypothetical protein
MFVFCLKASVAPALPPLHEGYRAITPSGKADNRAWAMRVAARQNRGEPTVDRG